MSSNRKNRPYKEIADTQFLFGIVAYALDQEAGKLKLTGEQRTAYISRRIDEAFSKAFKN